MISSAREVRKKIIFSGGGHVRFWGTTYGNSPVSKSTLVSLGHVLTTSPFSIGIGPKQVRPKVLNADVCTWPPVNWMNRVHRPEFTASTRR